MNCQFETLTNISFKHDYFLNSRFKGVTIRVPDSCIREMTNYGLLYKSAADGFQILFDSNYANQERTREAVLNDSLLLKFNLILNTPSFYNYTANLSDNIDQSIFYFSNMSQNSEIPLPNGILHQEEVVSEKDIYPIDKFGEQVFPKPFGLLDLKIQKGLEESYVINFSAKATFWRYILVSNYLQELHNPAILDTETREVFDGPEELMLPDRRKALSFTSKSKIVLRESIAHPFQLIENYEPGKEKHRIAIAALPCPDINTISKVELRNKSEMQTDFSEIFIY